MTVSALCSQITGHKKRGIITVEMVPLLLILLEK